MDNNDIMKLFGLGLIGVGTAFILDKLFKGENKNDSDDSDSTGGGNAGKQGEGDKQSDRDRIIINNVYRDVPEKKIVKTPPKTKKDNNDDKKGSVEPQVGTE